MQAHRIASFALHPKDNRFGFITPFTRRVLSNERLNPQELEQAKQAYFTRMG